MKARWEQEQRSKILVGEKMAALWAANVKRGQRTQMVVLENTKEFFLKTLLSDNEIRNDDASRQYIESVLYERKESPTKQFSIT